MQGTFTLTKDEVNADFWETIKNLFRGNVLNITVNDDVKTSSDESADETEYLLSIPANRNFLLESIKQGREGKITAFNLENL